MQERLSIVPQGPRLAEREERIAESDLIAQLDGYRIGDAPAVDECTIRRRRVGKLIMVVSVGERCMTARHTRSADYELVFLRAADSDLRLQYPKLTRFSA